MTQSRRRDRPGRVPAGSGGVISGGADGLEGRRNALGFQQPSGGHRLPIYILTEKASATQAAKRVAGAGLSLPSCQIMLSAYGSESSLKDRFNDSGRSDYSFWTSGLGKDTNHLIDEAIEAEITPAQEAEAMKLAESGMNYREVAKKLGVTALSAYYALKKNGKAKARKSIKPRSSALCHFDREGNISAGKGASLERTVRVSRGSDDMPLLFFVLRDSYSRVGGARYVIAACNGRQFTPDTLARVIVGTT